MRKTLLLALLPFAQTMWAQTECFTYEDDDKTIVSGVSVSGVSTIINDGELTIPTGVVTVRANALAAIKAQHLSLATLTIEGGDPDFELTGGSVGTNALADANGSLTDLVVRTSMSSAHLGKLLGGLDNTGSLSKIDIYDTSFPLDASITIGGTSAGVRVVLPAERVGTQTAGAAAIYGRFTLTSELATFCGNAIFEDSDFGSQFLFYVPDEVREIGGENRLHIQRVRYILPGQGVLLHKTDDSSTKIELPRVDEPAENVQYEADEALFESNMLRGVTTATPIGKTEVRNGVTYTNMILYNGFFYPTSGGTLGANRAYLQMRQSDLASQARMVWFVDDEATAIKSVDDSARPRLDGGADNRSHAVQSDAWYTLSGQRLEGEPSEHGIFIHQGKKVKL